MGLTPKRLDINNKILPTTTILTSTKPIIDLEKGIITIILSNQVGEKIASYWYEIKPHTEIDLRCISMMEALVVARFATESLINVINSATMPIIEGLDILLSTYGMANIEMVNHRIWNPKNEQYSTNTLMFSGGVDSTHLLFTHLKGNCNLVSFYHGQSNYRSGIHSEEKASFLVPEIARAHFSLPISQKRVGSRWNCKFKRKWAKAYRNLMFMVHAFTIFPGNIYVGTSVDDRLHDSFPDFIEEFSQLTGIPVIAPNLTSGRDIIMRDIVRLSVEQSPYLYASTCSCQLQRYTGKKFLNEGSCHSCILRLPAVVDGGDPRFSNFNKDLKLVPAYLENKIKPEQFYQRKPSSNALKTFFSDLSDNPDAFKCFIPTLQFIQKEWEGYKIDKILSTEQLALFQAF